MLNRGTEALKARITEHYAKSWSEFQNICDSHFGGGSWLFRGQSSALWNLETTLERATIREIDVSPRPDIENYELYNRLENTLRRTQRLVELRLLEEFKRRAHHTCVMCPTATETLEWMALMQHHGAPTRLLDWTASPYVAAFFAVRGGAVSTPV